MSKRAMMLLAFMGVGLAGSVFASTRGIGVPQPEKEPISIREGSARGAAAGGRPYRHVFIGGGIFHGK